MQQMIASLYTHRVLLANFVSKDIRGRFAGTMAGLLWTLLQPLALMGIYLFVFSVIFRVQVTVEETGTDRFFLFFLTGFLPWLFLAESLSKAVGSLLENAGLITRVVFPVELVPSAAVLSAYLVNGAGLLLLLAALAALGHADPFWLLLPVILGVQFCFVWGLALLLAALCVFVRDLRELLGLVLTIWFFATPIIYPPNMVPESLDLLVRINPMALYVGLMRGVLLRHALDPDQLLLGLGFAMFFVVLGGWFFQRSKPAFGDVL
jgi:lipopolysaccharide transport system permease protein